MANLNQMEFNSIREMVSSHRTMSAKLNEYAGKCSDPQITQMFRQSAVEANNSAQNLLSMM